MIALLRGLVAHRGDDRIVVDVQGVGYQVFVTARHSAELSDGDEVTLHIHTNVREDAIQLFGFGTTGERELFLSLNTVTGIGPKLAMGILSATTPTDLLEAVISSDLKALTRLPGIGKKTAQRILVELAEAFRRMSPTLLPTGAAASASVSRTGVYDDLGSALRNLGYKPAAIEKVVSALAEDPNQKQDLQSLLRQALKRIR